MTHHTIVIEPGDVRRAAAFLVHTARQDDDGLAAVLIEASEAGRSVPMTIALAGLFVELLPELRTPSGMSLVRESVAMLASMETTP